MTKLNDTQINTLINRHGFKRWTKAGMDRLYVNAASIGLNCSYHKTGSIKSATLGDYDISNSEARRIKGSKHYIDVATGEIVTPNDKVANIIRYLVDNSN